MLYSIKLELHPERAIGFVLGRVWLLPWEGTWSRGTMTGLTGQYLWSQEIGAIAGRSVSYASTCPKILLLLFKILLLKCVSNVNPIINTFPSVYRSSKCMHM